MRNPLTRPPAETHQPQGDEHLRQCCHNSNMWARGIGLRMWHYVEPDTANGRPETRQVDGSSAEEVWMAMDGHRIDYHGWPQEKLDKINRRARWLLKQGTVG